MSLLQDRSKTSTRTIGFRVPVALYEELEAIKAQAEEAGLVVDVAAALTPALQKAVREAREVLKQRRQAQAAADAAAPGDPVRPSDSEA